MKLNNKDNLLKIGLMTSGRGEGSLNLVTSIYKMTKKKQVKIEFIFCNKEIGESSGSDNFFKKTEKFNVPIISKSSKSFKSKFNSISEFKEEYEKEILNQISKFNFDLIFLTGYMLITQKIHNKYETYNLHPALPDGPKGKWEDVITKLIKDKSSKSGLMIHKVTDELDGGQPVTYCEFDIEVLDSDKKKSYLEIREKIINQEPKFVCKTLELIAKGKINLNSHKPTNLTKYLN